MIRAAFIIAGKDLRQRLRDRSAWILAVLVPLGLAFVLNLTLSGISGEGFSASFALYDADGGNTALAFGDVLREVEAQGFAEVTLVSTAR